MKWSIEAVNDRLKAGKIGVKVEARGDRLLLRATLPPKPGSSKTKPHQQYIALGIYDNPAGPLFRGHYVLLGTVEAIFQIEIFAQSLDRIN